MIPATRALLRNYKLIGREDLLGIERGVKLNIDAIGVLLIAEYGGGNRLL